MNLQLEGNKLLYHLDRLYDWSKGRAVYPLYLEIGPVSACNQRCVHCYISHRGFRNSLLKEEPFLRLINDISQVGVKGIQLAGCGEPLLNKAVPKAIREAGRHNISVALTTNGVLYEQKIIEETLPATTCVRVSILGGTPETYSLLHRAPASQFNKLLRNIREAVRFKKRNAYSATIGIAMFLFRENGPEILDTAKLMRDIGVDYFVVKCPGCDPKNKYRPEKGLEKIFAEELRAVEKLNSSSFHARVRWDQFAGEDKRANLPAGCLSLDFMAVVHSDGGVYSCNGHWGEKRYCYGNINASSFIEIWNSEERKRISERLKKSAAHADCYCICRNYSANKLLWDLTHPPLHVDLI